MIRELVAYYDRLAAGEAPDLPLMGYSRQKISFCIVLKPDGSLSSFEPVEVQEGKRTFAKVMTVPGQSKPPGKGFNPGFLWDNLAYMLGFKPDDAKPERTAQSFEAFRKRHLELEDQIDDPVYTAFCKFLRAWKPSDAAQYPILAKLSAGFGVVKLAGATQYLHERPAVRAWWEANGGAAAGDREITAPSLTDGRPHPIARLHEPKIKGVVGAQSIGATLVSFNLSAFESYGKSQSYNAPVSVTDAFKYCTALNCLTTDRDRKVVLGDTTVVYWAEKPVELESVFSYLCEPLSQEDEETKNLLARFFDRLRRLAPGAEMPEDRVPFYVLGLAPNAGRISVRFWLQGTVGAVEARLKQHLEDLQIVGAEDRPPLTLQRILDETGRGTVSGGARERGNPPHLR
jgi:CRISPR-associated protein Csd1